MQPLVWNNHGEWINIVKLIVKKIWGSKFVDEIENNDIYPFIANDNWISKLIESEKIKSTPFLDFSKEIANHWSHVQVIMHVEHIAQKLTILVVSLSLQFKS